MKAIRNVRAVWLSAGALLLAFWLRSANPTGMALFVDETAHIVHAHDILAGQVFAGLEFNRWLYQVVLAFFQPLGPEAIGVGRILSALCGVVSVAAVVALGRRLNADEVGVVAGYLLALMPLAVFQERQILVDTLMAAFTALSLPLSVMLARRPRGWVAGMLALTLAGAMLTKGAALPFLLLPPLAVLLLSEGRSQTGRALLLALVAAAVAFGSSEVLGLAAQQAGAGIDSAHSMLPMALSTVKGVISGANHARILRDLGQYLTTLAGQVGYVPVFLALLALVAGWQEGRWRSTLYLLIPAVGFGLAFTVIDRDIALGRFQSRYLLVTAAPLAVLMAISIKRLMIKRAPQWGIALMLVLFSVQMIWVDVRIIRDPLSASFAFAPDDLISYEQYLRPELRTMAGQMMQDDQPLVAAGEWEGQFMRAYIGPRRADFITYADAGRVLPGILLDATEAGQPVYLLGNDALAPIPAHLYGTDAEVIDETDTIWGQMTLYRAESMGVAGDQVEALLLDMTPTAGEITDDLSMALIPDATLTLIYPPLPGVEGFEMLAVGGWPREDKAAAGLQAAAAALSEGQMLSLVRVDAALTDPYNVLPAVLYRECYRVDVGYFGAAERRTCLIAATPDVEFSGEFEGGVRLSGAVTGPGAHGNRLAVGLRWEASGPLPTDYTMFAHVIDAGGNLVAQADSPPGAGAFPTGSWEAGQVYTDRFLIDLPGDLPSGDYGVFIGLYDPAGGVRLLLAGGGDAALLTTIRLGDG